MSGDRSEFFITIIVFILLIINIKYFKEIKLRLAVIIPLILVAIFFLFSSINQKYSTDIYENIKKVGTDRNLIISYHHEAMFKSSIKMFLAKPLLGHGSKMFRQLCNHEDYVVNIEGRDVDISNHSCSTHPHNIYLELLAEQGIIGFLIVFSLFIYFFIKLLMNSYYSLFGIYNKLISDPQIYLISIMIIYLFPLNVSMSFFNNWSSILFYFTLGIYISGILDEK